MLAPEAKNDADRQFENQKEVFYRKDLSIRASAFAIRGGDITAIGQKEKRFLIR